MGFHPQLPADYLNAIVTGDARVLAERIPDESIDLIFTDPVYDRIDDYRWLAETGARVLRSGGACLVWLAKSQLQEVLDNVRALGYCWLLENHRIGASNFGRNGRLITKLECCLWLGRGNSKPVDFVWDYHASHDWPTFHKLGWDKSQSCLLRWLAAFSHLGAVVFDPFTGGGTVPAVCKMLGRNYVAFEIDPETADRARLRVEQTQIPLWTPEPVQSQIFA